MGMPGPFPYLAERIEAVVGADLLQELECLSTDELKSQARALEAWLRALPWHWAARRRLGLVRRELRGRNG